MPLDDPRQEPAASAADAPASSGDARAEVRGGARPLWLRRVLVGAVALVVGLGAAVWVGHLHDDHFDLAVTAGSGSLPAIPSGPGLTAATIADGTWSAIARFPLAARSQDVAIWTGSLLIVWGGEATPKVFGDGAAYDPDTNKWELLPPAPIAGAAMASAVWTGQEMIVWGGERTYPGDYTNAGAAFDPATWTWRRIAASPLAPRYGAHMLWTGSEAVVVGGSESNRNPTTVLDAAAYDPGANRWHRVASLPGVDGAVVEDVRPVWTGRKILVWELWTRSVRQLTTNQIQLVEYDPQAGEWVHGPETDDPHRNVLEPTWTGKVVVVPAAAPLCDLPDGAQNCGPPPTNVHGSVFDPAAGAWRSIPHGPADDGADTSVWTGADLVVLSGGADDPATGKTIVAPGTAAAWNLGTNAWTPLPPAPFALNVGATIWTDREVVVWGAVTNSRTGALASRGLRYALAP